MNSHPEEVRKARETAKARSELRSPLLDPSDDATAASSPRTRPESPLSGSGAGFENADWSYARREAVVARLNGKDVNLDALEDADLNQLYSSILKVRHSRTSSVATSVASGDRPESRMSLLDSVTEDDDDDEGACSSFGASSRPYSGGTWSTDRTSMGGESTLTLGNLPDLYEKPFGIDGLDAFSDVALPSSSVLGTPPSILVDDRDREEKAAREKVMEDKLFKLERKMEAQRKKLERIRKSTPISAAGLALDDIFDDEYPPLSPHEVEIAQRAVETWRKRRTVRMAEDALSQAVLLKEANVLSRELQKGVSYQFVVIEGRPPRLPTSEVLGCDDIEADSDPALSTCVKPCVGVKVLDRRHQTVALWSLSKLRERLDAMRNLYKWIDKPQYSQHLSLKDPFYDAQDSVDAFSFVGSSIVSLVPLVRNLASRQTVQIASPYIADPIGSCRVSLVPLSLALDGEPGPVEGSSLSEGGVLKVQVVVDEVRGIDKAEFAAAKVQVSAVELFGVDPSEDDTRASPLVDFLAATANPSLAMTSEFQVALTPAVLSKMKSSHGVISVFARPRMTHLDKIERWDEARDSCATSKQANAPPVRGGDPANGDVTRRPENEFITEQQHDVLAKIEIRELGERGEYVPVPVVSTNALDCGAFFLRQGLQRRLVLRLSHNSGRAFDWKRVSNVSLGNVRLFDHGGRIHAATSAAVAELRGMGNPRAEFLSDGSSNLSFAAAWDSSVHDSPHLNCNTASGSRALVRLAFEIQVGGVVDPLTFTLDIAVTVSSRDARPPNRLLNMLTSTRLSSSISSIFAIRLSPFSTRRPGELWRLDTAETFVRGEESLAGWKPRGLSLVRDHDSSRRARVTGADVEATKAVLEAFNPTLPTVGDVPREERLRSALALWRKQFGSRGEVSVSLLCVSVCVCVRRVEAHDYSVRQISLEREPPRAAFLELASPSPSPGLNGPTSSPKLSGSTILVPPSCVYTFFSRLCGAAPSRNCRTDAVCLC